MNKLFFTAIVGAMLPLVSCSSDDEPAGDSVKTDVTDTEMTVSGVWKSGTEIRLDRHLVIPEGKSLTIEPGVSVIVSSEGVGVNHTPIEVIVRVIYIASAPMRSRFYSL